MCARCEQFNCNRCAVNRAAVMVLAPRPLPGLPFIQVGLPMPVCEQCYEVLSKHPKMLRDPEPIN